MLCLSLWLWCVLQEEVLITASAATVKSWTATQLKLEAQGDGLMFRSTRTLSASSSSLSNAASGATAANAAAAAHHQQLYPQQPQLQQRLSGYSGLSGTDTDLSRLSSTDGMASGGSGSTREAAGVGGAAHPSSDPAAISGRSGGPGQPQQQQQPPAGEPSATQPAAAAGGNRPGAVGASSGRFVAPSASKPNPFSRAAVEKRGMVVGPNNRVVPAILRGLPQHEAEALQQAVAPVMQMLTAQVCLIALSQDGRREAGGTSARLTAWPALLLHAGIAHVVDTLGTFSVLSCCTCCLSLIAS